MNPTQSFSNHHDPCGHNPLLETESKSKLMAIADVLHQDDVELLKQQLAAAHQLLSYRQDVIHALTEQINLKEACLAQTEQQTLALKRQCDTQQIELSEAQSVCSDLRELLKRQQRRSPSQNTHQPLKDSQHFSIHHREQTQRDTISFGYESAVVSGQPTQPLTKAPPCGSLDRTGKETPWGSNVLSTLDDLGGRL